jgi:hypothetical protein
VSVVDDVVGAGASVELVTSELFGIVARSGAFGDSEAIAKPIWTLAQMRKEPSLVTIANTLCNRVSGTVSVQRGYYRANLRGAWTELCDFQGGGEQGYDGERSGRVLSIQESNQRIWLS